MKPRDTMPSLAVLSAAFLTVLSSTPRARAELVYDHDPDSARTEDRAASREAISAAQKAEVTMEQGNVRRVQQPGSPIYIEQPAPPAVAAAPDADAPNVSHAELTRRQRIREEIRNEDGLQTRLEELRLRDEQRRSQQLLGTGAAGGAGIAPAAAPAAAPDLAPATAPAAGSSQNATTIQEQVIVAPTTNAAPSPERHARGASLAPASVPAASTADNSSSASTVTASTDLDDKPVFSVQPRIGVGNMVGSDGYDIHGKFSTGFGLDVGVSDNLTFEAGYQYSEYGVALGGVSPFASGYPMTGFSQDTMTMKQNVFDAGLKLHLTGPDSRVRPFVGAGVGYGKSYINYNPAALGLMSSDPYLTGLGSDYELSQFLGYLSAGLDVRVAKSVSVGLLAKYYGVLSSSQNQPLNNLAFYGPAGASGYGYQPTDYNKQYVGGSLSGTGFYSVLGNVTFSF